MRENYFTATSLTMQNLLGDRGGRGGGGGGQGGGGGGNRRRRGQNRGRGKGAGFTGSGTGDDPRRLAATPPLVPPMFAGAMAADDEPGDADDGTGALLEEVFAGMDFPAEAGGWGPGKGDGPPGRKGKGARKGGDGPSGARGSGDGADGGGGDPDGGDGAGWGPQYFNMAAGPFNALPDQLHAHSQVGDARPRMAGSRAKAAGAQQDGSRSVLADGLEWIQPG